VSLRLENISSSSTLPESQAKIKNKLKAKFILM